MTPLIVQRSYNFCIPLSKRIFSNICTHCCLSDENLCRVTAGAVPLPKALCVAHIIFCGLNLLHYPLAVTHLPRTCPLFLKGAVYNGGHREGVCRPILSVSLRIYLCDAPGKLFRTTSLPHLVTFLLLFREDKPGDWLLMHLVHNIICRFDQDAVRPSFVRRAAPACTSIYLSSLLPRFMFCSLTSPSFTAPLFTHTSCLFLHPSSR